MLRLLLSRREYSSGGVPDGTLEDRCGSASRGVGKGDEPIVAMPKTTQQAIASAVALGRELFTLTNEYYDGTAWVTEPQGTPAAPAGQQSVKTRRRWLADTGCPYDLTSWGQVTEDGVVEDAEEPVVLKTANGPKLVSKVVNEQVMRLQENIAPYLMDDSPDVPTVAFRCQEHGYGFHWDPSSARPSWRRDYNFKIQKVIAHIYMMAMTMARNSQMNSQPRQDQLLCQDFLAEQLHPATLSPRKRLLKPPMNQQ